MATGGVSPTAQPLRIHSAARLLPELAHVGQFPLCAIDCSGSRHAAARRLTVRATYRRSRFTRLTCVSLRSVPGMGEPLLLRSCAPVSPQE